MAAVAGEFRASINQEVAIIEMLMGGEAIAGLEEKVSGIGVPRAACVDVAGAGREMGKRQQFQFAFFDGDVAPEKILVGVVARGDAWSLFVEGVDSLVERIIAIAANEDSSRGQLFVAIATEGSSAAVAHGNSTTRIVFAQARIRFESGGERAILVKGGSIIVVVDATATAGDFAEEEPLVRPIVDVIAFGPTATSARKFERRRGAGAVIVVERPENFWRARILVVGGVSGDADAPVFVGIPSVVKDMSFGIDVRIHCFVEVLVKFRAIGFRPCVVTEVVNQTGKSEIRTESDMAFADRTVDQFHGELMRGRGELGLVIDD